MFQDHIKEVLSKWDNIDDKIIVLEQNRKVAKAYARAPVLTIHRSDDRFNGFHIRVAGFDNPMKDAKTDNTIRRIGQGFKHLTPLNQTNSLYALPNNYCKIIVF